MYSMSWENFLINANDFVKLSKKYQDNWNIVQKDNHEGNTYLVYKQKINIDVDEQNDSIELIDQDIEELQEDSSSVRKKTENVYEMEYHVIYSISYQVPVLYFKGFKSDGKPIALEDAWKIFQNPAGNSTSEPNMLSILTQSDHPVLFIPFLQLHPCRTAELVSQMGVSENIILTFLSIMGPFVRLKLKNEYGLAFKQ